MINSKTVLEQFETVTENTKPIFYIKNMGVNTPIVDTEFYLWLNKQKNHEHHNINSRKEWLDSLGFDKKTHRLSDDTKTVMRHTVQMHYDNTVKYVKESTSTLNMKMTNNQRLFVKGFVDDEPNSYFDFSPNEQKIAQSLVDKGIFEFFDSNKDAGRLTKAFRDKIAENNNRF